MERRSAEWHRQIAQCEKLACCGKTKEWREEKTGEAMARKRAEESYEEEEEEEEEEAKWLFFSSEILII